MDLRVVEHFRVYFKESLETQTWPEVEWELDKLDVYQEQPQSLDPFIPEIIQPCGRELSDTQSTPSGHRDALYKVVYKLMKIRSWKVILKLLPNDVRLFGKLLEELEALPREQDAQWRTRYVLLLWLSLIALTPFDMRHLAKGVENGSSIPAVERVLSLVTIYLSFGGIERDAAAELIARLTARPDVHQLYVPRLLATALEQCQRADCSVQTKCGYMQALCTVFKIGNRDVLGKHIEDARRLVEEVAALPEFATNTLLHKLRIKLAQRLALVSLSPTLASWRYSNIEKTYGQSAVEQVVEQDAEPDETVEDTISTLIEDMGNPTTGVRFSCAKGLARIAARLPKELAEEITTAILATMREQTQEEDGRLIVSDSAVEATWNGCCLAIAELCRTGALLPSLIPEVLPIVFAALSFDIKKGTYSIGNVVRDAACYVVWSIVRSFRSDLILEWLPQIGRQLIVVALFDREVSVRRAASAAFQETVGRHPDIIPHGISVMAAADFFSVGQRRTAYLQVARQVFHFSEYGQALLEHLSSRCIVHWDKELRLVAASCLGGLLAINSELVLESKSRLEQCRTAIDISARHGSAIAMAAVVEGLVQHAEIVVSQEMLRQLVDFGRGYDPRVFCGVWSGLMLQGVCEYIFQLSQLLLARPEPSSEMEQRDVETALLAYEELSFKACGQSDAATRAAGVRVASSIYEHDPVASARLAKRLDEIKRISYAAKLRGYVQMLGVLRLRDARQAAAAKKLLLNATAGDGVRDPEVRQLAVESLGLFATLNGDAVRVEELVPVLQDCLQDYSVDARGDVGSWTREAAVAAFRHLVNDPRTAAEAANVLRTIVPGCLQQCFGKIDNLRSTAVALLAEALTDIATSSTSPFSEIDTTDYRIAADTLSAAAKSLAGGAKPESTFASLSRLLDIPAYRRACLRELMVSAGSGGHASVSAARSALISHIASRISNDGYLTLIVGDIVSYLTQHGDDDRIVVPVLQTTALLAEDGLFDGVAEAQATEIFDAAQKAALNTRNFAKLSAALDLYAAIAGLPLVAATTLQTTTTAATTPTAGDGGVSVVCERAWRKLALTTSHRLPRARQLAAERLWGLCERLDVVSVLAERPDADEAVEATERLIDVLMETDWTAPTDVIEEQVAIVQASRHPLSTSAT